LVTLFFTDSLVRLFCVIQQLAEVFEQLFSSIDHLL
jgi:hypothetical protein